MQIILKKIILSIMCFLFLVLNVSSQIIYEDSIYTMEFLDFHNSSLKGRYEYANNYYIFDDFQIICNYDKYDNFINAFAKKNDMTIGCDLFFDSKQRLDSINLQILEVPIGPQITFYKNGLIKTIFMYEPLNLNVSIVKDSIITDAKEIIIPYTIPDECFEVTAFKIRYREKKGTLYEYKKEDYYSVKKRFLH